MWTRPANPIGPNRLVEVLEDAFSEIFAHCVDAMGQFVARRGAADRLAGMGQARQRGRQLLHVPTRWRSSRRGRPELPAAPLDLRPSRRCPMPSLHAIAALMPARRWKC